jgi:hypothetical protein
MDISLTEQLRCAKRELALRNNVYPRWVAADQMTAHAAKRELAGMTAIVQTLERLCTADAQRQQPALWPEEG